MSHRVRQMVFIDGQWMKTCSKCRTPKSASGFYHNAQSPDGHTTYCKLCNNERVTAWVKANPERAKTHPSRTSAKTKKRAVDRKNEREYGLTVAAWEAMLINQSGHCAACQTPLYNPVVDHDHVSGVARGLLCQHCNSALGYARDSEIVLKQLRNYLTASRVTVRMQLYAEHQGDRHCGPPDDYVDPLESGGAHG